MKKNKIRSVQVGLILVFALLVSSIPAKAIAEENNADGPLKNLPPSYSSLYLQEKNLNSLNLSYEEQDTVDFLDDYYRKDQHVVEIVKKYYKMDSDTAEKFLSVNAEDKIEAMSIARKIYGQISDRDEQEELAVFMSRYAYAVDDKETVNFLRERAEKLSTAKMKASNFDTVAAANWAFAHWNIYSTDFPKLTKGNFNDCTNFVSQALFVGGHASRQRTWYCYKKNSKYLVPENIDQLNDSWDLADPSPWISAEEFPTFWEGRGVIVDYKTASDYVSNHADLFNRHLAIRGDGLECVCKPSK